MAQKKILLVSDDLFFSAGFISTANSENRVCEHINTRQLPQSTSFNGLILIDTVSLLNSFDVEKDSFKWPEMKKTHFSFITSCNSQARIIELIFTDFIKIDRKITIDELRKILRGYSQPCIKKEKKELTPRERQMLLMRLSGMSVRTISKELNVHIKTTYAHLYSVLVKSESKSLINFYSLALPLIRVIKRMECNFSTRSD